MKKKKNLSLQDQPEKKKNFTKGRGKSQKGEGRKRDCLLFVTRIFGGVGETVSWKWVDGDS